MIKTIFIIIIVLITTIITLNCENDDNINSRIPINIIIVIIVILKTTIINNGKAIIVSALHNNCNRGLEGSYKWFYRSFMGL